MGAAPKIQIESHDLEEEKRSSSASLRLIAGEPLPMPLPPPKNQFWANFFIIIYLSFLVGVVVIFELYY